MSCPLIQIVADLEQMAEEAWGTELETLQWYLGQLRGQSPLAVRQITNEPEPRTDDDARSEAEANENLRVLEVLERAFDAAKSREREGTDLLESRTVHPDQVFDEVKRWVAGAGPGATDADDESDERAIIGHDIPWAEVSGVWMRAIALTPLATINDGRVRGISLSVPYGVLDVEIWTDPDARNPGMRALLPIRHREDYKAVSWALDTSREEPSEAVWVMCKASRRFGSVRPMLAVIVDNGARAMTIKKANDPFRLPRG